MTLDSGVWSRVHHPPMDGMRPGGGLRIGEVAARTGVSVDALRYYERRGILPAPQRRQSGYRIYTQATVQRVQAIKWAQALGFRLREIPPLLQGDHGRNPGARRRAALLAKGLEVGATLRRLQGVRKTLGALAACHCRGSCPIVEQALATRRQR